MALSAKDCKHLSEVGKILVRLAALEDANERAILASDGVSRLFEILADNPETNLDKLDVPDFMKQ